MGFRYRLSKLPGCHGIRLQRVLIYLCIICTVTMVYWKVTSDDTSRLGRQQVMRTSRSDSLFFVHLTNQRESQDRTRARTPLDPVLLWAKLNASQSLVAYNGNSTLDSRVGVTGVRPGGDGVLDTESLFAVRPVEMSPEARTFLSESRQPRVAVGGGLTSSLGGGRYIKARDMRMIMPFFRYLLPTFCKTASPGYEYHFYFAYDYDDPVFSIDSGNDGMDAFVRTFTDLAAINCKSMPRPALHMIRCGHKKNPAWAQNDAMMQAYLDGMDFFYRVNDDTTMLSTKWTETFIGMLGSMSPRFVGVVGPKHSGGNTAILTYDFVHRRHIEMFGFYYPREFTSWWADDWITKVYNASSRMVKMNRIFIRHVTRSGSRYQPHFKTVCELRRRLVRDTNTLVRYISLIPDKLQTGTVTANQGQPKRVIAMSLVGGNDTAAMGAIRNAQLRPLFFPEWTMRLYLADDENGEEPVADNYVNTLHVLGVELVRVRNSHVFPSSVWHYLAADDTSADVVIMRNVDGRLSSRDASLVSDWLSTSEDAESLSAAAVHCISDQQPEEGMKNNLTMLVDGLWAVRPKALLKSGVLKHSMKDTMITAFGTNSQLDTDDFLQTVLWPAVRDFTLCHSVFQPTTNQPSLSSVRLIPPANASRDEHTLGTRFTVYEMPVGYNSVIEEICPAYRQILLDEEKATAKKTPSKANPALLDLLSDKNRKITFLDLRTFGIGVQ